MIDLSSSRTYPPFTTSPPAPHLSFSIAPPHPLTFVRLYRIQCEGVRGRFMRLWCTIVRMYIPTYAILNAIRFRQRSLRTKGGRSLPQRVHSTKSMLSLALKRRSSKELTPTGCLTCYGALVAFLCAPRPGACAPRSPAPRAPDDRDDGSVPSPHRPNDAQHCTSLDRLEYAGK